MAVLELQRCLSAFPRISGDDAELFEESWDQFVAIAQACGADDDVAMTDVEDVKEPLREAARAAKNEAISKNKAVLKVLPAYLPRSLMETWKAGDRSGLTLMREAKAIFAKGNNLDVDKAVAGVQFQTRTQKPTERVLDFLNDLRRLNRRADPAENETVSSAKLLARFMAGLRPDLRVAVYKTDADPSNLETAVEIAEREERALQLGALGTAAAIGIVVDATLINLMTQQADN